MVFLATLWIPIILSAVIVFVASSIMHVAAEIPPERLPPDP